MLLKNLSTWGIGGPCKYFARVFDQTQLICAIRYCNEHSIRFMIIGMQCATEGLTGLEFAGGIPGTVGAAAYMNAGANGLETADTIDCVEIITTEGEHRTVKRSDLDFGYPSSPFRNMKTLQPSLLQHSD
ncbi:udp-n-acetylenolpyruvoylglucosamine reductase [Olea europaea subsp. europaea]|uniref:Udp-n-acetylenolpyruvoylglucosamine reductase n=1 Tax=Olea europaea subsp. europaea TaxID=158383 RepID=A0A8S0PWA4_OLEEU|nr:udp-n-acetylenolpyruvoylglucosamine reductase [Olea europaea subsp. europaea]